MHKLARWTRNAVIGVFALLLVLYLIGRSGQHDSPAPAPQVVAEVPLTPPPRQVHRVTAQELFDAYEANEVAADETMKDKAIEVTGIVQSVDKDMFGNMVVELRTRNRFMPARMQLEVAERAAAAKLTRGAKAVVLCSNVQRVLGTPLGGECSIQG